VSVALATNCPSTITPLPHNLTAATVTQIVTALR
jgi:hypothetical protein